MRKNLFIQIYDYSAEFVVDINTVDIIGTIPAANPDHVIMVNYDGIGYEVSKALLDTFGVVLPEYFDGLMADDLVTAEDIETYRSYGLLNDDEYERLMAKKVDVHDIC